MTNKKDKLLDYLLSETNAWITSQKCSDYLNISTRQLRKYVSQINSEQEAPIILSSNKGYKINLSEYNKYLHAKKNETPKMRENHILQRLIISKDGVDIFDLSEELFVSLPTIENDLKNVRKILNNYSLILKRNKDNLQIQGKEKNKRNLISWLISNDSYESFILQDEIKLLTFHYELYGFQKTIKDIFTSNNIFVNDYTFNNIILHLIITIDRIKNNFQLSENVNLDKIKELKQYNIVLQIQSYIENMFHITISKAELYNISLVIFNNTSMIDYASINADNIDEFIEMKYINITKKVISEIENVYCLEPFDNDFIVKFTIHIKNLFERAENNYSATNPLTHKIKNSYPLIYDMAVYIAQIFNNNYKIILTEDEIAFLAFHIGSYFETNIQNKSKVICAFIYADYYSFHNNIIDIITRKFDEKIVIKYATSITNFKELKDVDLIISTVQIPFHTKYVTIHPFINDVDIKNIELQINKIMNSKKATALKNYLSSFFDSRLFYKNPKFESKDIALKALCDSLFNLDLVEPEYFYDVMQREKMSSTAFGTVAIPHVLTKTAKQSFISIVITEDPIQWDNQHQVFIIAMIGIHDDSRKIFSEVFESLIEVLSNPSNVKNLILSKDFDSFIALLKSYIDNNMNSDE